MLITITIPYTFWLSRVTDCGFSVAPVLPLTAAQFAISYLQCSPSPPTELILLGLPPWIGPLALTQPYGLLSWVEDTLSSYHHTSSAWIHATVYQTHERVLHCFWTSLMLNIIGYSCWTTFSAPSNWVTYTVTFSVLPLCNLYKFCIKVPKDATVPYKVLVYLLFPTLGLVDLDTEPGQLWLCIRTVLFPFSMSPLCDFASHCSLQRPIVKMRPPCFGWSFH